MKLLLEGQKENAEARRENAPGEYGQERACGYNAPTIIDGIKVISHGHEPFIGPSPPSVAPLELCDGEGGVHVIVSLDHLVVRAVLLGPIH